MKAVVILCCLVLPFGAQSAARRRRCVGVRPVATSVSVISGKCSLNGGQCTGNTTKGTVFGCDETCQTIGRPLPQCPDYSFECCACKSGYIATFRSMNPVCVLPQDCV